MAEFKRGLEEKFVKLLNEEYNKGGWWRDILKDPQLNIGIRNNYLDVYYRGNSLFLIKYSSKGLLGQTHYKYLIHPEMKIKPIIFSNGTIGNLENVFINSLDEKNIGLMKRASNVYAGEEKKGIQWILNSNPNIIDMEIALTQEAEKLEAEGIEEMEEGKGPAAQRIDFAALQKTSNGVELVFFEAKLFSNKELRAVGEPRVVRQIKKYQELIEKYVKTGEIEESYKRICRNIVELNGMPFEKKKIAQTMLQKASVLSISDLPRLVIFGFDQDQKMGDFFKFHIEKLEKLLGKDRLLVRGNPNNFTKGISFVSQKDSGK